MPAWAQKNGVLPISHEKFLMLRNHGLLTVGRTMADAFLGMYVFEST
jgi:ribulose-5-phosphate 4-epimerase/fuculose-1-phosphate aldolase